MSKSALIVSSCGQLSARSQSGLDTLAICARLGKSWVMKEWIHGDIWQGEGSPTLPHALLPPNTLSLTVLSLSVRGVWSLKAAWFLFYAPAGEGTQHDRHRQNRF